MAINDKDEKLQHDINRAAAKISALSSGKKKKDLPGKEIWLTQQHRLVEDTEFSYTPLRKML